MTQSIAVFAEDSLLLEALLEAWQETDSLQAYTPVLISKEGSGNSCLFRNKAIAFHDLAECKQKTFALAMVLAADEEAKQWLQTLDCPVIGSANALADLDYEYFSGQEKGLLAVLQSPSIALQHVLGALECAHASAAVLMPASYFGKPAVEELASQTVNLLNAKAVTASVFQQQLSFNVFPFAEKSFSTVLQQEWRKALPVSRSHINVLQAPVFHGMALQLNLELSKAYTLAQLLDQWRANQAIAIADADEDCSVMNAVQLDGAIQLGCVQLDEENSQALSLWLAFDDVQLFARQGLISAAELLLKHHL